MSVTKPEGWDSGTDGRAIAAPRKRQHPSSSSLPSPSSLWSSKMLRGLLSIGIVMGKGRGRAIWVRRCLPRRTAVRIHDKIRKCPQYPALGAVPHLHSVLPNFMFFCPVTSSSSPPLRWYPHLQTKHTLRSNTGIMSKEIHRSVCVTGWDDNRILEVVRQEVGKSSGLV